MVDMMPSCHSLVLGSNSPYIWPAWFNINVEGQLQHLPIVMLLGFSW
jgi:hypothetical protein